jgi:hypothetical protein
MIKISCEEYQEFLEHYSWQVLKSPDYRLGQAFLNYFPHVGSYYLNNGEHGESEEHRLWNSTNHNEAQGIIDKWRHD